MAEAKTHTVVYRGRDNGRRSSAYELESNRKTWTFPLDREVTGVPETVVKTLGKAEGFKFDIRKEG